MKYSAALLLSASAASAYINVASFEEMGAALRAADNTDMAGAMGPLKFTNCGGPNDLAEIVQVTIEPNPPVMGKPLLIKATGTLKQQIEEGATAAVNVKAGIFKYDHVFKLCDILNKTGVAEYKDTDIICPVEPKTGKATYEKHVNLPNKPLPALLKKVEAQVVVKDKSGKQIVCQKGLWEKA